MTDHAPVPEQPVDDTADEAAGHRVVIDQEEAAELPATDPNVAAGQGDHDHENHVGDELDRDPAADAADDGPKAG